MFAVMVNSYISNINEEIQLQVQLVENDFKNSKAEWNIDGDWVSFCYQIIHFWHTGF